MKHILYTLLTALFMHVLCMAQPNMVIVRYTTDNGLPSNTVNCVTKDRDGFMWLGTLYGLSSFDGTEFMPYVIRHSQYSDIPPRKVLDISEDNSNNLWIRTSDNRFYRFDKTTETFHDMYTALKKVSPNLRVIKVQSMDNGHTLIYTRSKSLYEVYVDKNNKPKIEQLFDSRSAIDKASMKLRSNVLGETARQVFWLGPNFEVKTVSKNASLSGKHILRTIPVNDKATCFYHNGNCIYIGTDHGEVFIINVTNGERHKISSTAKSSVTTVTSIGKNIFFTTADGIYSAEAKRTGKVTYFQPEGKLAAKIKTEAETAFADNYGKLWLFGVNSGITMFDPSSNKCRNFHTPQEHGLLNTVKFCDAGQNGLFILLRNGKVMRYDRSLKAMLPFAPNMTEGYVQTTLPSFMQNSNPQNVFYDMSIDDEGLLWLTSTTDGLFKVRFPSNQFSFLYTSLLADDIHPSDINYGIRSLLQARNGDIWIGTRRNSVYRIDSKTGKLKNKFTDVSQSVYHIMEDSRGNIWLSSKGSGLTKATPDASAPQGMRFTTFRHSNADKFSISDDRVYYTFEDSKGRIWACTYGGGLNLLTTASGKTIFINKNNMLKNYPHNDLYMNTREIAEDKQHTLWIATTDGLMSFDGNFRRPQDIKFNDYRKDNNPTVVDNDILSLMKDSHGNIWLSIFGCGLNKITGYDNKRGKLLLDTFIDNGLQGNIVSTLVEDKKRRIWFTTENGLASMSEDGSHLHTYGYLDGFLHNRIEDNTAICLDNGNLLIGCQQGIVSFSPDNIERESRHDYRTFIVDFKVQNRNLNSFDPPISGCCPKYAKEIVLEHNQNMFSIEFSALKFTSSSNTAFTYILDGYEDQWHANDNSRVASYANVPPGEYTFRVKSLDGNSPECSLKIKILPPWWLTWWAYIIYGIIVAAAVYAGIRLSLTMLKMRNEVYINNRLAELKIRFFTNISHELRTPLTLIKGPIDGIRRHEKLSPEGKEYLNLIDRNASKMLHLVNQILDFRKVQNSKMPLHLSHANICDIAEIFREEYSLAAKERNISLLAIKPEEPIMAWCDAEKIGVIINNLINNAFKYTNYGGKITIAITEDKENGTCRIRVEDDGAGIPEQQLDTIFERFSMADNSIAADMQQTGTGIGLSLAREYANMHHGKIEATNLSGNQGVAFTLQIPTSKDAYANDNIEVLLDDKTATFDATVFHDAAAPSLQEEQEDTQDRPTLVLVEDNQDLRSMLSLQLRHDYNVVTATDGADGIDKIRSSHPDLIITDLMMPRMDGAELLRQVRKDFAVSHIPIIVLTAKSDDAEMTRLIANGANAFIKKPFSHDMLMARIRQLVQEQRVFQRKMILQGNTPATEQPVAADDYEKRLARKDMEFIQRIHDIIKDNLQNESFNIDTIAETVGLSRSAFFKKLKSLTGYAPVDLVREIRLGKAEELVLSTDSSVAEIAYAAGFKDASYFGKCFKKKYGMTPLEYRSDKRKA